MGCAFFSGVLGDPMSLLYRLLELLEAELSFWKLAPTLRYGGEAVLMEIPEYSR